MQSYLAESVQTLRNLVEGSLLSRVAPISIVGDNLKASGPFFVRGDSGSRA